jgi:tetratricopeptide (TPR) repeat protein
MEFRLSSAAFIVVLATYLFLGLMGLSDRENPHPRDDAYNLLARGLLSGHLSIDKEAPAGLARLADPYDPVANKPFRVDTVYRLHDFSYYRGKLYLYFGIAPALFLFIPWHLLTGGWLPHWVAVVLVCTAGLLVNLSLVRSLKRRIYPDSPPWMMAAVTLILGFASYAPVLLSRADMWEVAIGFSALSVSVALRCLWGAFCSPSHSAGWIALASAALGAAFASRPNLLPAAAILLLPFFFPETRRNPWNWVAAAAPLALCGLSVAAYNQARFNSPFEFGTNFVLQGVYRAGAVSPFSVGYFWTNVRLHLFQPVAWSSVFPYAHEPADSALRPNPGGLEHMSGILLNAPILWAALIVPVFILMRRPARSLAPIALAAGWCALSALGLLLFFAGACARYQFEYTPALALLASVGVIVLESVSAGGLRMALRCAWVPALLFSSAFPVLYGIDRCAQDHDLDGFDRIARGDFAGAEREFDTARLLSPGSPFSRLVSGAMLSARGRSTEALAVFESLVRDHPDYAMGQSDLGHELVVRGRLDEAIVHYKIAHRLAPDDAMIEAALNDALAAQAGRAHP